MAPPQFGVASEREGSITGFLSRQWSFKPVAITDVSPNGKTAVIVGDNCGIGLEVARQFLDLGLSRLIISAHSEETGKAAVKNLQKTSSGKATIGSWPLELASYDFVVAFAKRTEDLKRMDYTVLNVGMCAIKFRVNESTEHEETIQVNRFSSTLLTGLLAPVAKARPPAQGGPPASPSPHSWTSFKEKANVSLFPAPEKGASDLTDCMMAYKLPG